jgi:hypothetical protein
VLRAPGSDLLGFAHLWTSLGRALDAHDAGLAPPGDGTRSGGARIETPLRPGACYGEGTFELGNRAHSLCLTRNTPNAAN